MRPPMLVAVVAGLLSQTLPEAPSAAIALWNRGQVAFGVFVPTDETARRAAYINPRYDFLFLNLEQRFDASTIKAVVDGLRASAASPRKTLLVRIPPVARDGAEAVKARITEAFALRAHGVTVPHVRDAAEAEQVLWFFRDMGLEIWSPANRSGDKLAMLMIEDPGAVEQAKAIADLKGYSILACGIGSLTQALGGNREAAEAGNLKILGETKRAQLVNMITTTMRDVEQRVQQGFRALIAIGPNADETIALGRRVAGRR